MKTRSSSGVGQKIDLGFDVDTLRIFDLGEDADDAPSASTGSTSASNIVANIKRNNTASSEEPDEGAPAPKIRAETDSTKLRDFLNNLS
jgi:hypothetical protein